MQPIKQAIYLAIDSFMKFTWGTCDIGYNALVVYDF